MLSISNLLPKLSSGCGLFLDSCFDVLSFPNLDFFSSAVSLDLFSCCDVFSFSNLDFFASAVSLARFFCSFILLLSCIAFFASGDCLLSLSAAFSCLYLLNSSCVISFIFFRGGELIFCSVVVNPCKVLSYVPAKSVFVSTTVF